MASLNFIGLGHQEYSKVLEQQFALRAQRKVGEIPDTILTVEHPRVITQGRRPAGQDFRVSPEKLREEGFSVQEVNRGGKLTYHGPGQLVAYFIVSLVQRRLSIPSFVNAVEEIAIQTLGAFGVKAQRREGKPGVWTQGRKIVSIGLSVDRGVSMHGMALNINPNLQDFQVIVPCGMEDCSMTSIQKETGLDPGFKEVEKKFRKITKGVFG